MSTLSTVSFAIKTDAAVVANKFATEWGAFRRFVSAHPLTAVILTSIVVAVVVGFFAHVL